MGPYETVEINEMVAACSGSGGALGHPRVYLNLAPHGRAECPYCSRTFVNRHHTATPTPATDSPPPEQFA